MFRSYLNAAFRNFLRNKKHTTINLLGLSLGLAAFIVIFQYVSFEYSFDRFHKQGDRIQRLTIGPKDNGTGTSAMTAGAMAPILYDNYSGIRSYVRLRKFPSLVTHDDTRIHEDQFYFTDSTFFQVFSYELTEGDKDRILQEPNTLVLTETAARRLFGKSSGLLGETVRVDNYASYRIDGIVKDPPANAHFSFEYLASIASIATHPNEPLRTYQTNEWYAHYYYTFFQLEAGVDPASLQSQILEASKVHSNPDYYELYGVNMGLYLQPIADIHLNPLYGELEPQGNADNLYILSSAGLIILLLAIVNYANLSTAQSIRRVKEVALRKTMGAERKQLILQFLGESIALSFVAFILAISLIQLFESDLLEPVGLPANIFNSFYEVNIFYLLGITCVTGLIGGLYPAFYLSSFGPGHLFKDGLGGERKFIFRKVVVFFQFAISMLLISGTVIVFSQVQFMQNQELGIDTERILVLPTYGNANIHAGYDRFRQDLSRLTEVESSTLAELSPGDIAFGIVGRFEGMEANKSFTTTGVDHDYLKTYGLDLIAGRDFSRKIASDSEERIIINRKLCEELGWTPEEAIGKTYDFGGDGITPGFVIGVMEDFHFNSLRREIFPMVLALAPDFYQKIAVKLNGSNLAQSIEKVETAWQQAYPEFPFSYQLVDQEFNRQYAAERGFGALFLQFTVLGLLIGAFGIYGLIQLMTEYRRKEMSIRKVLGAPVWRITVLLTREYMVLMALAFLVAAPLAYIFMNNWLADFAYAITVKWWMLGMSLVAIALISFSTIGSSVFRTARANPVDSLRYE
ncbi:MAG: ABC transporter permease [Roseivirga sp.]